MIYLIIVYISGIGVEIETIEFNHFAACDKAVEIILESKNKQHMTAVCVPGRKNSGGPNWMEY